MKININSILKKYINNFDILVKKLTFELKDFKNVFTHNPWGEYGHEEHIQVFKAIEKYLSVAS